MRELTGTLDRVKKYPAKCWPTCKDVGQSMAITIVAQFVLGLVVCQISPAEMSHQSNPANGRVLPVSARPFGYSLAKMAEVTAVFNTGDHSSAPPVTPIQMLYTSAINNNTFDVFEGTILYVPVLFTDDSPPLLGDFPYAVFTDDDPDARNLLRTYMYGENEIGVDSLSITVDGKVHPLAPDYFVGVTTPPLSDGGGTHYIAGAAFVSPLSKGTHTVEIDGYADGAALLPFPQYFPNGVFSFSIVYTVTVH